MQSVELEFADLLTDRLRELLPDALIEARVPPEWFGTRAIAVRVSQMVDGKEVALERGVSIKCDGHDSTEAAIEKHAKLILKGFLSMLLDG